MKVSEVSILIPTFNRKHLIRNAIESSLAQTYKCEIIVCDHGSNDGTLELCESYGNKIIYIRREKDYGIHFCELEALLASSKKYIHFCFDDDWMHPQYIEASLSLMDSETGIVICNYKGVKLKKSNNDYLKWEEFKKIKSSKKSSIRYLPFVMKSLISPSRALIRKRDALKCIYMSTNLVSDCYYNGVGPDWLMTALPLFRYKKCGVIENTMINFGIHENSITIDALKSNDEKIMSKFRAAYSGARLYLLVSTFVRLIKLEFIFQTLEKFFRMVKSKKSL